MFNVLQLRKFFGPLVKAAPKRPKPRPTVKPRLEALEERWCPSTTWNPGALSQDGNNPANYSNGLPSDTNPLILDGAVANKPIEFTGPIPVGSITVQNAYNNTLTTDDGAIVSTSANDTVKSGCILTLVLKAPEGGIQLTDNAGFTVASGGTLNLSDLTGATQGVVFLSATGLPSELNDAGTVNWYGTAVGAGNNAVQDHLGVPVLNTGTFNADGGTKGQTNVVPGQLAILDGNTDTYRASFAQTSGSFNLKNGAYVTTQDGYFQTGGSLTSDSSSGTVACTLVGSLTANNGDIDISGGKVVVDNVANTVGTLVFSANTVEINGEIDVDGLKEGGNSTASDLLDLTDVNTVTLQSSSYLNVGTTGTGQLGIGNQWTVMTYKLNALQGSWTSRSYPAGMTVSTGPQQVLVSN